MKILRIPVLVLTAVMFMMAGSLGAQPLKKGPPDDKGKVMIKVPGGKKTASYAGNGPPPWAPAHGYRRNHHERWREYGLVAIPIDIPMGRCNREVMGQVLGGAIGGIAGSQIGDGTGRLIAVAAGTLVGLVIGGEIGRSLDKADQLCMDQAFEHAPDGSNIRWNTPDRQYTVTPRSTVQEENGRYCREYSMDADVGGRVEQVFGMACRQPDGSWQLQGSKP